MKEKFVQFVLMFAMAIGMIFLLTCEKGKVALVCMGCVGILAVFSYLVYCCAKDRVDSETAFRKRHNIPSLTRNHVEEVISALRRLSGEKSVRHTIGFLMELISRIDSLYFSGDYTACANAIADGLGLRGYYFRVVESEMPYGVAGCTRVRDFFGEVEIRVAKWVFAVKDVAVAVICHEVGHQLLRRKDLDRRGDSARNEFLVDVACVYFGLGALMLRGCEWYQANCWRKDGTLYTNMQSLQSGYALPPQLALVYDMVARIAGIKLSNCPDELSESARKLFGHYRKEMRDIGCDLSKVGMGERAVEDLVGALRRTNEVKGT